MRRALRAERPDVLVEDINKLPLFLASEDRVPFCAIVPHLFGATAFEEAQLADGGYGVGEPSARWRGPTGARGFHAISESTRDDLVARGVSAGAHPGDPSRRGQRAVHARAGGARRAPTFLYVGRLEAL